MKHIIRGLCAAAAMAVTSPALAADFINVTGAAGTYGNPDVICPPGVARPCAFTSTFTFSTPVGYELVSASMTSVMAGNNQLTNIDFTSVTLNGIDFDIIVTGVQEFRNLLNQTAVSGGLNTIVVSGFSGGDAAFSGNLSFAEAITAVPESSTWAMMIIGLGAVGGSMRLRRKREAALAA